MRRSQLYLIVPALLVVTGCVWIVRSPHVAQVSAPEIVSAPVKVFVSDGSVVVFPGGASIVSDEVRGSGVRYDLTLSDTTEVERIAMDSVIGIEAFTGRTNTASSTVLSVGATLMGAAGTVGLAVAVFGSCPTIYTQVEDRILLQAETFSYSIAPLLEGRDLDRLDLEPDPDGVLRLEIRNEALETHYINHLQLLPVAHAPGASVLPDDRGRLMSTVGAVPPSTARDRDGRSVVAQVRERDGAVFGSADERVQAAGGGDPHDELELAFPAPKSDTAVLALRMRNSLLTTVLFYDLMLGDAGASAVDWLAQDLDRISDAVALGAWVREHLGMRVEVHDGRDWVALGRIPDSGPIAWHDVGIRVPVPDGDVVRLRLSFLTDQWRVDQVSLGALREVRPLEPLHAVRARPGVGLGAPGEAGAVSEDARRSLSAPDEDYLVTHPGTRALLEFQAPGLLPDSEITYFLSSQGYYTEWIRPEWIRRSPEGRAFQANESVLGRLFERWGERKGALERDFFESRIPVG